jgi:lipid-A-disaccharide synthase
MSWLSYQIMSRMITIDHIGLANIVADQHVVEEFLQDDANAETISTEISKLLDNEPYRSQVIDGLSKVRENLGQGQGSERMAQLVNNLLP